MIREKVASMVLSLKEKCNCIGLSGNVSIMDDFFGYRRRTRTNRTLSLRNQLQLLQDVKHVSLNIIKVGIDLLLHCPTR